MIVLCVAKSIMPTGGQVCASVRLAFVYARVKVNWHIRLSHPEIFRFQDVIKKKFKKQFSYNFKIFTIFIFFTGNLV